MKDNKNVTDTNIDNLEKDIENNVFNAMKEYKDLADKLKTKGKNEDYILIYSKGYYQGEYDTKQKTKSELETYKKIAEKLAEEMVLHGICSGVEESDKCYANEIQCGKCIIDWARKEVENEQNNNT